MSSTFIAKQTQLICSLLEINIVIVNLVVQKYLVVLVGEKSKNKATADQSAMQ